MKRAIVVTVVVILFGIAGAYIYSNPSVVAFISSAIFLSTHTPSSIAMIEGNVTLYLGKQVALAGTLVNSNSSAFRWATFDSQGYTLNTKLPNDIGMTWVWGQPYSFIGIVSEVDICSCPAGFTLAANATPTCDEQVPNPNWTLSFPNVLPHYFTMYVDCPISIIPYLNVTSATLQH